MVVTSFITNKNGCTIVNHQKGQQKTSLIWPQKERQVLETHITTPLSTNKTKTGHPTLAARRQSRTHTSSGSKQDSTNQVNGKKLGETDLQSVQPRQRFRHCHACKVIVPGQVANADQAFLARCSIFHVSPLAHQSLCCSCNLHNVSSFRPVIQTPILACIPTCAIRNYLISCVSLCVPYLPHVDVPANKRGQTHIPKERH